MKKDIETKTDVELLVNTFYDKVKTSSIIGPIFNEIINVDWKHHLPKMYSFWASVLLGEHSFSGNPMQKHIQISKLTKMSEHEFLEWLKLFNETTNELFEGEKAEDAKTRAENIARLMLYNIQKA